MVFNATIFQLYYDGQLYTCIPKDVSVLVSTWLEFGGRARWRYWYLLSFSEIFPAFYFRKKKQQQ